MPTEQAFADVALDVSVGIAQLVGGEEGFSVKISSPAMEINVWLSDSEAKEFSSVLSHEPSSKAHCLGSAAGSKVHWSRDADDRYYLLVGEDDDTWDIGITINKVTVNAILNALKSHIAA